ncbi:MAG: VWA domain-containing protein [Kineosporiaceae bacterium]
MGRVLVTLVVLAVAVAISPPGARLLGLPLPWASATSTCTAPTTITVAAAPRAVPLVEEALAPVDGTRLSDERCLTVQIQSQAATDVISGASVLPPDRAPQVWIPDSSLWVRQIDTWEFAAAGSLATSPIIVAGSPAAVDSLGWATHPPAWGTVLSGEHPVALPDLRDDATASTALLGLWQSLGMDASADKAIAAAVISAARADAPSVQDALQAAADDDPKGPFLITSEATVVDANRGADQPRLVAVYPRGGSPALDFPLIRVAPKQQDSHRTLAVDAVLAALGTDPVPALAHANGLRDGSGAAPEGTGIETATVAPLAAPSNTETAAFLGRLRDLQVPSRILTVMDVSPSMRSGVPGTPLSRVQLAGQAAIAVGNLLSDRSSAGLWIFSLERDGALPYRQITPLAPLGTTRNGQTHRDLLDRELAALPDQVGGAGTALYATAVASVRTMTEHYQEEAVNSVVLFTDGSNENDPSISLNEAVAQLTALHDPRHPVQLIAIGIGPTADVQGLQALVAPTGGKAYRATTPQELRQVLFDSLARRTGPA